MDTIAKAIISVSLVSMMLALSSIFPTGTTLADANIPSASVGFSGFPLKLTNAQNIIDTMDSNGLNIYRMSFSPEWYSTKPRPYNASIVQYFLDHSNYLIIVDRNHIYPPGNTSAMTAKANWNIVRNSVFEVLQTWPNNSRVAVELINEYSAKDFYSLMQQLVNEIRGQGYTNPIVVNKYDQRWTKIVDPLDNTFQGYHFYFNYWSVSGAVNQMKNALTKGIKIINTEVGADSRENRYFTADTVNELNTFLSQSASLGVANCVWMSENLNNLPKYQSLGLVLPTAPPPIQTNNVTLVSEQDNALTNNLGSIAFDSKNYTLPNFSTKTPGNYSISYYADSNYRFSHWITSGPIAVANANTPSTTLIVSGNGDGELKAIYYQLPPPQHQLHIETRGLGSTNVTGDTIFDAGSQVPISAAPNSGWTLSYWLLNGSYVNPANPYILTMDSNYNLTAIFSEKPIQCRLHVEVNGSGVTNTTGDTLWDAGTTVNVLATANQGWKLSHWLLNDANSGTINPYSLKINDDYNLTAVFTPTPPPVQVQLNIQVVGSGFTNTTGDTLHDKGSSVGVLATANKGWGFSFWLLNDTDIGSTNPLSIAMNDNYNLTAVFTEIPIEYQLVVNIIGSGSVTKVPDQASYISGAEVTLNAIPDEGWIFNGWNGDQSSNTTPIEVTMNTNESITATFTPNSVDHLFEDDFESGTLAAWNGADGAATVSTINPYQGTYHLACRLNAGANNGWSGTYKSVSGTNPLSVSAYVYFNSPPNTDNEDQWVLCLSSSTAGNALAYAGLRRVSGTLYWSIWYISDGTTFTYQVSSSVYSAGWHHLDLALFRGTSNDGWIKLFVDGAETCLASNLDNDARSLNYARVGFSYSDATSSASSTVYIDEIIMNSKIAG